MFYGMHDGWYGGGWYGDWWGGGFGFWAGLHLWFLLALAVLFVLPFWRIFARAGFPGVLSVLMLVPMVNLVVLYIVAFAPWRGGRTPERGQPPG